MSKEPKTMRREPEREAQATPNNVPAKRRGNPMMHKGWAGGPGRPKKVWTAAELLDKQIRTDLRAAAKDHSPEAFRTVLEIMRDSSVAANHRLAAAGQILDRGWGKPTNHTQVTVDVYEKMSDVELIKLITGKELDDQVIAQARESMTIEHEPLRDDNDAQDEAPSDAEIEDMIDGDD